MPELISLAIQVIPFKKSAKIYFFDTVKILRVIRLKCCQRRYKSKYLPVWLHFWVFYFFNDKITVLAQKSYFVQEPLPADNLQKYQIKQTPNISIL